MSTYPWSSARPRSCGRCRRGARFRRTRASKPTLVHVLHLSATPDPARVEGLTAEDWSPDAVAARGDEVVLRFAKSQHRSRLDYARVLRRLGVDGTARNWRTLAALVEMAADA
ncbi:MAG: hypothetical protein M3Q27_01945 [Actinomycetota bacterium]|nr:hypothetical protein [Actinomycetota bacterium]